MSPIQFRVATRSDVVAIVALLADDALGRAREQLMEPLPESYYHAFDVIETDPNNELLVACRDGEVIGTLQLTYTPSLSYQGSWRCTVESVRVAASLRGQGIGARFMEWALERARARGCHLVQLSTHRTRTEAHRFYEQLGFESSHVGMKRAL